MKQINIDLIGTYPPPVGGTSIHIQRLLELNVKNGINCVEYDTHPTKENLNKYVKPIYNYKKFILKYFFDKRAQLIHSHTHSWVERMILTLKAKICNQKIVFTFHSFRDSIENLNLKQKISYKYVLKNADIFIATNESVKLKLIKWGCSKNKIKVISPFLFPSNLNINKLDVEIENFILKYSFIIVANASNNDHYLNEDLYGIDMCIELTKDISEKYDIGFIFVLTKVTDKKYLEKLKQKIEKYSIKEKFLLLEGPINFVTLLKFASIFVRPTNTDTWGISISESIYLGVPCIASDICKRENGTIVFETRNQKDFNLKVMECVEKYKEIVNNLKKVNIKNNYIDIYNTYLELIEEK